IMVYRVLAGLAPQYLKSILVLKDQQLRCSARQQTSKLASFGCIKTKLQSFTPTIALSKNIMQANNNVPLPITVTDAATDNNTSPVTSFSPIEIMLNSFIEQQTIFNKNMSESMSQQTVALQKHAKLQEDMNLKLNEIKKMSKMLNEHDERINKLEKRHDSMSLQINEIKNINNKLATDLHLHIDVPNYSSTNTSADVIIVGVPEALSCNPLAAVSKVLRSIDAALQIENILDIRKVNTKSENIIATSPKIIKSSFIVCFKSPQIAAHIISKKRRHGTLTIKDAFDDDTKGNIVRDPG
ncbi:hypothetical protein PV326_001092, partial [Microctonus aethiopoides]